MTATCCIICKVEGKVGGDLQHGSMVGPGRGPDLFPGDPTGTQYYGSGASAYVLFHKKCMEQKSTTERDVYMALVSSASGSVFVKELAFFRSQGGFREDWGKNWAPIVGTSIEDARERACDELTGARLYAQQAK